MAKPPSAIKAKRQDAAFENIVAELLADPQYAGNPLREALAELFSRYQEHLYQLEKITRIADGFQDAERQRGLGHAERYRRQLRQLEKIIRISDRYQHMLHDLNQRLHDLSNRDGLTDLPNRRFMLERLGAEINQAQRLQQPLAVALVDVDHFKRINDRYGHGVGDQALCRIAASQKEVLRDYDVCGRWGGEEFLILLPQTDAVAAERVVERLCRAIGDQGLPLPAGEGECRVTVSIGVTVWRLGEPLDVLLKRADDALYMAKRQGRNRYIVV
jgi:diguanylate cyclase (GGDEF)-like protein